MRGLFASYSVRFSVVQLLLLCITAGLLYVYVPVAGHLDVQLIAPYIDPQQGFILKSYWWYDHFAHKDLKIWQDLILLIILIRLIASRYHKSFQFQAPDFKPYLQLFVLAMVSMLVISVIKKTSYHSCPWYMLDTTRPTLHFLLNQGGGKCFPGGHASLGYAWCAGFFAFLNVDKKRAYFYLLAGLILGTLMGWIQMMRGAHFLSHNLWTLWFTWAIDFGLITMSGLYVLIGKVIPTNKPPKSLLSK